MGDIIGTVTGFVANYWDVVLAAIGLFALIATKTPNTSDDKIVQQILDVVNFFGGNFGKAKNTPE